MDKAARSRSGHPQTLRVYRDGTDQAGTVMCPRHRDHFFSRNPAAYGCGEYGGVCTYCP